MGLKPTISTLRVTNNSFKHKYNKVLYKLLRTLRKGSRFLELKHLESYHDCLSFENYSASLLANTIL